MFKSNIWHSEEYQYNLIKFIIKINRMENKLSLEERIYNILQAFYNINEEQKKQLIQSLWEMDEENKLKLLSNLNKIYKQNTHNIKQLISDLNLVWNDVEEIKEKADVDDILDQLE